VVVRRRRSNPAAFQSFNSSRVQRIASDITAKVCSQNQRLARIPQPLRQEGRHARGAASREAIRLYQHCFRIVNIILAKILIFCENFHVSRPGGRLLHRSIRTRSAAILAARALRPVACNANPTQ
jgi:hypothetical protein